MKNIIQKKKDIFKNHINKLFINKEMKSYISDDLFIDKNPDVYLFYPEIFFPALNENNKSFSQEIKILNIAGYLYYRSILEIDSTIDNVELPEGKQPEKHFLPILSSICQEESIKLLTSLFQLNPVFWKRWNTRRAEYLHAIIMDKKNPEIISLDEYEVLADYKSAFGKIAIDAIYTITGSNKTNTYQNLLESHKMFSIGFQLLDDILDFKKDIINPQINFAYISLKNYLNEKGIDYNQYDSDTLNKYLYIYGVAEKLIKLSIDYLNKSLKLVENYKVDFWSSFIQKNIYKAKSMFINIKTYDKLIDARIKLSKTHLEKNSLVNAIDLTKKFLISNQDKKGFWEDFVNNAGISNIWATGYILSNISDLYTGFDKDSISRACQFLIDNKQGLLWGYNTNWIEDVDSTTLVLLALKLNSYDISGELELWLKFQKENGAFSTYPEKDKLAKSLNFEFENFDGWAGDHNCVSAMAYYFLSKTNIANNQCEKLRNYLFRLQKQNGLLESYWWTSPIYATSYFLQANFIEFDNFSDKQKKTITSLIELQSSSGSFVDNFSQENPLYTALALSTICSYSEVFKLYRNKAEKAVNWLISQQYADGSFVSSHSLQIPLPKITDPAIIKEWSKTNQFSTNVVEEDYMRLFTTSAVLKALDTYHKLLS